MGILLTGDFTQNLTHNHILVFNVMHADFVPYNLCSTLANRIKKNMKTSTRENHRNNVPLGVETTKKVV